MVLAAVQRPDSPFALLEPLLPCTASVELDVLYFFSEEVGT